MPGKAVNQSHWSKPFDTVLPTGMAKKTCHFGHVDNLKTTIG